MKPSVYNRLFTSSRIVTFRLILLIAYSSRGAVSLIDATICILQAAEVLDFICGMARIIFSRRILRT